MILNKNQQAFFALIRSGLWEDIKVNGEGLMVKDLPLTFSASIDWQEVYRIAEEQSVIGLVAAGLGKLDVRKKKEEGRCEIPIDIFLTFIGQALVIEQHNKAMNEYVAWLFERLQEENVHAILVKGQGIAQCYKHPLWRACGDIDLLLDAENYEKAKKVLLPLAIDTEDEIKVFKHIGMTMEGNFVVELHGTLHSRLSGRVDRMIDKVQEECLNDVDEGCRAKNCRTVEGFKSSRVQEFESSKSSRVQEFKSSKSSRVQEFKSSKSSRVQEFKGSRVQGFKSSKSSRVQVPLPGVNQDVIFVFTHILHHFYIEGIGLRQICDWCRLLWTYRDELDVKLLESRIREMGLMSEWRAFAALAVEWLGMPVEAMPLYVSEAQNVKGFKKFKKKAGRIIAFVMETGNFGHNRQLTRSKVRVVGKLQATWYKMRDFARHTLIFPWDSVKFFIHFVGNGVEVARNKEG